MFFAREKFVSYFNLKKINRIIKILTFSDLVIIGSFGLVEPIFAVFITDSISGGGIEVVGIASSIFLLAKSLGQIPAAAIIDKIRGEKDDFWFLFGGSLVCSLIPLLYIFVSRPIELYVVQLIYGLASASLMPAWYAIFTRHVDKDKEAIEWGVYRTILDMGGAIAASLGGFIASIFGFDNLFLIVSSISFLGAFLLLLIKRDICFKKRHD